MDEWWELNRSDMGGTRYKLKTLEVFVVKCWHIMRRCIRDIDGIGIGKKFGRCLDLLVNRCEAKGVEN